MQRAIRKKLHTFGITTPGEDFDSARPAAVMKLDEDTGRLFGAWISKWTTSDSIDTMGSVGRDRAVLRSAPMRSVEQVR
jgi:hypothetical protein